MSCLPLLLVTFLLQALFIIFGLWSLSLKWESFPLLQVRIRNGTSLYFSSCVPDVPPWESQWTSLNRARTNPHIFQKTLDVFILPSVFRLHLQPQNYNKILQNVDAIMMPVNNCSKQLETNTSSAKGTHHTQSIPFHADILYYWVDYWGIYSTRVPTANPLLKHPPSSCCF